MPLIKKHCRQRFSGSTRIGTERIVIGTHLSEAERQYVQDVFESHAFIHGRSHTASLALLSFIELDRPAQISALVKARTEDILREIPRKQYGFYIHPHLMHHYHQRHRFPQICGSEILRAGIYHLRTLDQAAIVALSARLYEIEMGIHGRPA